MQKKFLKNLTLILFLNLLIKPFWILGVDRQVYNVVGPEDYGFYFSVFNFSFLFFIFLDLGITNFNNRNIAQNNQLLSKHFAGIGTIKLLLGLLYGVIIFIVGYIIGYRGEQLHLLFWVGFNQFLLSFLLYLRSNISGLLLFVVDSFLSILDRLLMIAIVGVLLWTGIAKGKFNIEWFVYSQTVAYLVTVLIALGVVLIHSGKITFSWNPAFFIMIIKKSLPFALLVLLMSFYNRIDPVFLERLIPGKEGYLQSGIYSAAFRMLDAGQNFAYLFAVLLLPLFSKMIKEKQSVAKLLRLSFSIIISGSLIIAVTAFFYDKELMLLMYVPHGTESAAEFQSRIVESAAVFRVLMFSFVAISSNYIFGTLLTANNNLKQLNIIAFVGMISNILMNLVLIPRFQALGSSYASLTAQGLTAILNVLLVIRVFRFRVDWILAIRIVFIVLLTGFTAWFLKTFSGLTWPITISITLAGGLIYAFLLRLLDIKHMVSILKENN
jgi:O-antigen/teichoic acid export membrane protein